MILYSRLVLLAIPLVLERMLSTIPAYWDTRFHYSLAISPVLAMGAADGLQNVVIGLKLQRRLYPIALAACAAMLFAGVKLAPRFGVVHALDPGFYSLKPNEVRAGADGAVARVPDGASVVAQDPFLPHLSARDRVYEPLANAPLTDYILVDVQNPDMPVSPVSGYTDMVAVLNARRSHYRQVYSRGGVVLLKRVS